ncbi:MAG: 6-bladed beta-propeller, partial [Candidatus Aminicenantes bacterium]|nr:6-bladed beta-propeller [Candidatus Aminicenantes bacterium]
MKKLVFAVVLLCFWAACGTSKTEWTGSSEVLDGVTVVSNPDEPLFGELTLDLEKDLKIGTDTDDNSMFYRVRGIAVDERGRIFVADMSNYRVQVFDGEGRYVQTIGRSGQGPGEFETHDKLRFGGENGNLYVLDRFRTLEIFDPNGKFITSVQTTKFIKDFIPIAEDVLMILFVNTNDEELTQVEALQIMDGRGEIRDAVGEFPVNVLAKHMPGGGTLFT